MEALEKQKCPLCFENALTLREEEREIPFFGKVFLFGMSCSACKYHMSDVESEKEHDPTKQTFTLEKEHDLSVRVIKSSHATVKIPQLKMTVSPGPASIGYISNIEGVLARFEKVVEDQRDNEEDPDVKKKAKVLLKKMWKAKCGDFPLKIIIEDPTGNSAIISEKTVVEKIKGKKEDDVELPKELQEEK